MAKRPKAFLPLLLIVSLAVLIVGIFLFVNFNRRKALLQKDADLTQETSVSEDAGIGLPDDFPVYPSATEDSSYSTEGDKKATSVVWKTEGTISEVSSFFNKELEIGNWEITSKIKNDDSTTFSFTRGENYGFIGIGKGPSFAEASEGKGGGVTVISVTIGER